MAIASGKSCGSVRPGPMLIDSPPVRASCARWEGTPCRTSSPNRPAGSHRPPRWPRSAPRAVAGKEASYVQGRHNGKMRAKTGGALGLVGFVTIDPRDPRAMQGTRHSVTEAGIGNLIDRLAQARRAVGAEGRTAPQVI